MFVILYYRHLISQICCRIYIYIHSFIVEVDIDICSDDSSSSVCVRWLWDPFASLLTRLWLLIVDVVIDLISDTEGNDIEDREFEEVSTVKKEALCGGEETLT